MSVTVPKGFVAAGTAAGIKAGGVPDLALVATAGGMAVPAAAVFTVNRAAAAPVQVSRAHLGATGGRAGAVVLSSGNANAATGAGGIAVAERTCAIAAHGLGLRPEEVLVCSTGLIGIPLPLAPFERGLPDLLAGRGAGTAADQAAARAIMTTDTRPKQVVVERDGWRVGGMAKGAAMLSPNMATMLAVLTTDTTASPESLRRALGHGVAESFNAMSIDGCCSTNDTVIVLASGEAPPTGEDALAEALAEACASLADQMAEDAEGATKVVTVVVRGAASAADAVRAARRVADSQLVQASVHGADPYWGRVVSELGASGAAFELTRVRVAYGSIEVCREGQATGHDGAAVAAHMAGRRITIEADLGLGSAEATVLSTDLSPAYVELNATTS